jgi:hypothetical protein
MTLAAARDVLNFCFWGIEDGATPWIACFSVVQNDSSKVCLLNNLE